MCSQLEAILLKHRDISVDDRWRKICWLLLSFLGFSRSLAYQTPSQSVDTNLRMEKVEHLTAVRAKNSFSIDNILSRPDNCENQRRLIRQNPFQNNHVLFYENSVNQDHVGNSFNSPSSVKSEVRSKNSDDKTDIDDIETNSEAASDDGNSSVHSK